MRLKVVRSSLFRTSDPRSSWAGSSPSYLSIRIVSSASQIWSRASLCGVPESGASRASAQSSALSQISDDSVVTVIGVLGGSS
ncbi:hypothetical protein GCM10027614_05120 [Micromonospora vulcania]